MQEEGIEKECGIEKYNVIKASITLLIIKLDNVQHNS